MYFGKVELDGAMSPQPLLLNIIIRRSPSETVVKCPTVVVLVKMHQLMQNQIIDPFGGEKNQSPEEKELALSGARSPTKAQIPDFDG
jgi:hypothetical protein